MMKKILLLISIAALLCSCGSYKRLAYLQDMEVGATYDVTQSPETRIGRGDMLRIMVYSSQPELAAPFNVRPASVSEAVKKEGSTESYTAEAGIEYTVDTLGCINFPVLGKVYAEGMTLSEMMMSLAEQIKATGYLNDPMVKVEFCNFQVTVLGEVASAGNYIIPTGNVNIFELLAMVGDLSDYAQRDNIWVIRTVGNARKVYSINLKSKDVYQSPAFYLQQKDMVYVAPKNDKIDSKISDVQSQITWPFMIITSITSAVALILTLSRL